MKAFRSNRCHRPLIRQSPPDSWLFRMLIALSVMLAAGGVTVQPAQDDAVALTQTICALDAKILDACNRCDLDALVDHFAADVEFHHDEGGLSAIA
jgi:hypothetical protein